MNERYYRYCNEEKSRAVDKVLEELSVEITGQFAPEEAVEFDETVGKYWKRFEKINATTFRESVIKKLLEGVMDSVDAYVYEMYRSHSLEIILEPFAQQLKSCCDLVDTFPVTDFTLAVKDWCIDLYRRICKAQIKALDIIRREEF